MEFFTLWPGRGYQAILRGPYPTVERAAAGRIVNGDIVVVRDGTAIIGEDVFGQDGALIARAPRVPRYRSVANFNWLWDWETEETSRLAWSCNDGPVPFYTDALPQPIV